MLRDDAAYQISIHLDGSIDKNVGTLDACKSLCDGTVGCNSIVTYGGGFNCKGMTHEDCPFGFIADPVPGHWKCYVKSGKMMFPTSLSPSLPISLSFPFLLPMSLLPFLPSPLPHEPPSLLKKCDLEPLVWVASLYRS